MQPKGGFLRSRGPRGRFQRRDERKVVYAVKLVRIRQPVVRYFRGDAFFVPPFRKVGYSSFLKRKWGFRAMARQKFALDSELFGGPGIYGGGPRSGYLGRFFTKYVTP